MTREEMEELKGLAASMGLYDDKNPCKRAVILGKVIKALEQQPCEDCISRQAAIVQLSHNKNGYDDCDVIVQKDIETIKALPPVNLQKSGKWIYIAEDKYRCSKCSTTTRVDESGIDEKPMYKFCPYCGSRMEKSEE